MTNFQASGPQRFTRERVLLWSPVALGGLLAVLALAALGWPAFQRLQEQQRQLADLKEQKARLPLLRQQLAKNQENLQTARLRERRVLQLIAGSGEISTFMAQLGQEARRSGVLLDSYEPFSGAASPAPAPAKPPPPKPATPPAKPDATQPTGGSADPLLASGLQKTTVLITARGSGPQLLDFLRRLERLTLLVVQSDLALQHQVPAEAGAGKPAAPGLTSLKLNLTLYSKAKAAGDTAKPAKS